MYVCICGYSSFSQGHCVANMLALLELMSPRHYQVLRASFETAAELEVHTHTHCMILWRFYCRSLYCIHSLHSVSWWLWIYIATTGPSLNYWETSEPYINSTYTVHLSYSHSHTHIHTHTPSLSHKVWF